MYVYIHIYIYIYIYIHVHIYILLHGDELISEARSLIWDDVGDVVLNCPDIISD